MRRERKPIKSDRTLPVEAVLVDLESAKEKEVGKLFGRRRLYCRVMATNDSTAQLRTIKRVQFGILGPDEIVSGVLLANGDTRRLEALTAFFSYFPLWPFVDHSVKCLWHPVVSGTPRLWSVADLSLEAWWIPRKVLWIVLHVARLVEATWTHVLGISVTSIWPSQCFTSATWPKLSKYSVASASGALSCWLTRYIIPVIRAPAIPVVHHFTKSPLATKPVNVESIVSRTFMKAYSIHAPRRLAHFCHSYFYLAMYIRGNSFFSHLCIHIHCTVVPCQPSRGLFRLSCVFAQAVKHWLQEKWCWAAVCLCCSYVHQMAGFFLH